MYSISTVAGVGSLSQTDLFRFLVAKRMGSCGSATGSCLCPLPAVSNPTGTAGVIFDCGPATGSWLCPLPAVSNPTGTAGVIFDCGPATGSWLCPLPAASDPTGTTGVIFGCGSVTGSILCRLSAVSDSTRTTGVIFGSTITDLMIRGTCRVGMFEMVSLSLRWGNRNSKILAYLYGFTFSAACPLFGFFPKFRRNWSLILVHLFLHSNAKKTVIIISIIQ